MSELQMDYRPELREPAAVLAFSGWNDAASSATNAAKFISQRLGARRFARIDTDSFTDFRSNRPSVRIRPTGERDIVWPSMEFFAARNPNGLYDIVIGVGAEPNTRWPTFADTVLNVLSDLEVKLTVTLGALLADAPHTRPVKVTGSAPDPELAARLGLSMSRYEGPTGIVGVLTDTLRRSGMQTASLWANCPHYVSTNQNPPATAALVSRLGTMLHTRFDIRELDRAGERFIREVNSAVAANPEISAYVSRLEAALDAGESPEPPLASDGLLDDIESFLRNQKPGESDPER